MDLRIDYYVDSQINKSEDYSLINSVTYDIWLFEYWGCSRIVYIVYSVYEDYSSSIDRERDNTLPSSFLVRRCIYLNH